MNYTFELLESFTDGRLEEIDEECWNNMRMIKTIRDTRKFKQVKQ